MEQYNDAACLIQTKLQLKLWLWKIKNDHLIEYTILRNVPRKIKNNLSIVIAAMKKKCGLNLEFASLEHKNDFAVVIVAVSTGWIQIGEDDSLFMEYNNTVQYSRLGNYRELYNREVDYPIQFATEILQMHPLIVKASLERHGGSIIKMDRTMYNTRYNYDHDMIMIALQDEDMKFMLLEKKLDGINIIY